MNKYQEALDKAIQHCNDVVNEKRKELNVLSNHPINKLNVDYDIKRCIQCKDEHWQLKKWLEELKILRKANEWIPIEERLPNKEEFYLVTCKPYDDTKVIVITSYFYGYGEVCQGYREFPEGIWEANQIGDVLAWMPLPEPYKGVRKDVD